MDRSTIETQSHAQRRRLLDHQAHVWIADPGAFMLAGEAQRFEPLLCAQERARWQGFHFPRDRLIYLVAHGLLCQVLSLYEAVAPNAWRFRQGQYGKPAVAEPERGRSLSFNLSHTDGAIAIIVTNGGACGVDVERIGPHIDTDLLGAAVFAPAERQAWRTTPDYLRVSRFLETWTLKEAYLKGIGWGIGAGVECVELCRTGGNEARVVHAAGEDEAAAWRLNFFHLPSGHVLSTALAAGYRRSHAIVIRRIELHRQTLENSQTLREQVCPPPADATACTITHPVMCRYRRSLGTPMNETIYFLRKDHHEL